MAASVDSLYRGLKNASCQFEEHLFEITPSMVDAVRIGAAVEEAEMAIRERERSDGEASIKLSTLEQDLSRFEEATTRCENLKDEIARMKAGVTR